MALVVARGGSLARAAEALAVDPATISRRITALESALGVILFVRSKLGVTPTDAGLAVIARAAEIEQRAMRIEDDIAATATSRGAVRVAGGPWATARIARAAAPILRRTHPQLELRLVVGRPPIDLPGGEPAIAVWFEVPTRFGEFAIGLGDVPYAFYAAVDAPGDALPRVAHRNEDGPACELDRGLQSFIAPGERFALTATDSLILREAAAGGMGSALLPMCLGDEDARLRRVGGPVPALVRRLHVHTHPDTVQLARVQATIECLRANFDAIFGPAPAFRPAPR